MPATTTSEFTEPRRSRAAGVLSVAAAATLILSACGDGADNGDEENGAANGDGAGTVTVEDNHGSHEINMDEVDSVVATSNQDFRTLEAFGVELSAAPRQLMDAETHGYAEDEDILDTGNHREPDLEQIIAAEPDLIINGQRYGGETHQEIEELVEDAGFEIPVLELNPPEDQNLAEGLIWKTETLGEIFGQEDQAQELIEEFEAEIERVNENLPEDATFMALMTSGGDISYLAPGDGRTLGPLFDIFDLEPALDVEVEDESHGDDISVEAIAEANPDWLLVTDRDARLEADSPDYQPADELLSDSPALQQTTAIEEDNIVFTPDNMYLTEDIQAYTELFSDFADTLEAAE